MHTVEQVGRDDIWGYDSRQRGSIIVERVNNAIIEVIAAHSLDGSLVKDKP